MTTGWGVREEKSVSDCLHQNATDHADRVALWVDGEEVTHGEMLQRSIAFANGYAGLGLSSGDVVATFMSNRPEHAYSWHACWHMGAAHVPINTAMRGEFLRHQLVTSGARAVVVEPDLAPRVIDILDSLPNLEHLILRGANQTTSKLDLNGRIKISTTEDLLANANDRHDFGKTDISGLNAIIFTGGTTGPSKAVAMSRGYVMAFMESVRRMLRFDADSVFYQPTPMFHVNAAAQCIILPTLVGGRGCSQSTFSASGYWDRVSGIEATHASIFGSLYLMLWAQPERDNDSDNPLRVSIGNVPAHLNEPFRHRFGIKILQPYAMSEALPITLDDLDNPGPPGTSGRPNPDFDVRIFDETEQEVPMGETGEVVLRPRRPYVMFSGYHNAHEATANVFRNLWFHTGDIGKFDSDGYFVFVDRKADYLRRRGVNISCWEVEQVLLRHPLIEDVAVHGVPSEIGEEDVKACLVLVDDASLDLDELLDFCSEMMPPFAVPRYIDILDVLPRSPLGRITKKVLREAGNSDATFDRERAS